MSASAGHPDGDGSADGAVCAAWDEAVGEYLDHLAVERGLAANTVAAYRRDLRRYASFCTASDVSSATEVGPATVAGYVAALRAGQLGTPLSDASVGRAVVAVRGLHAFLAAEGVTEGDPAREVSPPSPAFRLPKGLPVDDVVRLLEAPDPHVPTGLRDRAILELLYGTGCRVSELTGADVDDLDTEERTFTVVGKGNKQRMVPVGRQATAAVEAYLVRARPTWAAKGRATPALFLNPRGGRLSRQSVWTVIGRAARTAGLTDVHPHTLRHSYATHLLQGGADVRVVQELLGHASVTTTQIYTMVTIDHLREVYATTHPRGR